MHGIKILILFAAHTLFSLRFQNILVSLEDRKIIHIDMDAFFASVEQRDFPELRGKPVAVGGNRERGVVAAASYEARKYGVHSAMSSRVAAAKCPGLIFVKHRFDAYKAVSRQIREIFKEYTDLVEPLSLDEAFLDVTRNKKNLKSATLIAEKIRQRIKEETQLTASAGVSVNKFLAKVASDINKPDGLTLIAPDQIESFIQELPIKRFFGIGKVTAARMNNMGIFKGKDLQKFERPELVRMFGKSGGYYFNICRGVDHRPVKPDRVTKSVSGETTYNDDLHNLEVMKKELKPLSEVVSRRMVKADLKGKTITLKMKLNDFSLVTRSHTIEHFTNEESTIFQEVVNLLEENFPEKPVRLLGVGVSKLNVPDVREGGQLTLNF